MGIDKIGDNNFSQIDVNPHEEEVYSGVTQHLGRTFVNKTGGDSRVQIPLGSVQQETSAARLNEKPIDLALTFQKLHEIQDLEAELDQKLRLDLHQGFRFLDVCDEARQQLLMGGRIRDALEVQDKMEVCVDLMNAVVAFRLEVLKNVRVEIEEMDADEAWQKVCGLSKDMPSCIAIDARIATLYHQLCDRCAEKYRELGDVESVFKTRRFVTETIHYGKQHPLYEMSESISPSKMGTHWSGLDTGHVKGGNLTAYSRIDTDGHSKYVFEFKLTRPMRERVSSHLEEMNQFRESFTHQLPDGLKGGVEIRETPFVFKGVDSRGADIEGLTYEPNNAKAIEIAFQGIGTVRIGACPDYWCLDNQVTVELDADLPEEEKLQRLHEMLTMLGIGPVLGLELPEDEERMKIHQLLRAYYPALTHQLENNLGYYENSPQSLRDLITRFVPAMEAIFRKYLDEQPELMQKIEIYPGKEVWGVVDLADQMREAGGWGLMMGLGTQKTVAETGEILVSILRDGALSSLDRFEKGDFRRGQSPEFDLQTGGGDQVFTRLIKEGLHDWPIHNFMFSGHIQLLINLDAVNRVAYGFNTDFAGSRSPLIEETYPKYTNRPNLIDFSRELTGDQIHNEVMLKGRLSPEYIQGVVVKDEATKEVFVKILSGAGLVEERDGERKILGKSVDEFFYVSEHFEKEMWRLYE